MDLNLLKSLIGNLNIDLNIDSSDNRANSPDDNSRHRYVARGQSVQIIINGDVVQNTTVDRASRLMNQSDTGMKEGYHAVFLTNGQVYFGKLEKIGDKRFVKLTDVFYLNDIALSEDAVEITHSVANDYNVDNNIPLKVSLVKLGSELHAPVDVMNINVDQIIFWERLKDTGDVVQSILRFKSLVSSEHLNNDL